MSPLNAKYTQILWMNVLLLSGGVGFLVFKRFDGNLLYTFGAAGVFGVVEYFVMRMSLTRKQGKEDESAKKD